jgi:D-alanyl-D-alanine carboxypeptidase
MLQRSIYLLLLILAGTVPARLSAQSPDRAEALDEVLSHFAKHDKFMGSLAFFENGRVRYQFAYGMADVETEQVLNVETRFRIGSISKTVTAVLILQLIEQDKLDLDTPLARFFPQLSNAADITIADLLYHRSGLASFTDQPDYTTYMTEPKTREELLALMAGLEPVFAPRERNEYSNSNYVLLGYILEEVTGKTYGQVLKKQITQPLGLAHLYYGGAPNPLRNEAYSYRPGKSGWEKEPITDMSIPHGAGALVATPAALTRFMHALFSGELVSESSLEQMTTLENGFGMGLFRFPFDGRSAYGHNGGIDGFVSNVAYFPEEEMAIAVTVNALDYNLNDILIAALSTWFGVPYELPDLSAQPIELSAEQLAAYAGTYASPTAAESGGPATLRLWVKDGQLLGGPTEENAIPLTPFSPTTFRFDPAGLVLEFGAAEAGTYRSFTLQQRGREFVYERQPKAED